jgi:predicted metalloprotease
MADIENFPLAVDGSDGADATIDGSTAGAAGPSTGGMVLSHGALVAIIVVVVVVAVFGSQFNQPTLPLPPKSTPHSPVAQCVS